MEVETPPIQYDDHRSGLEEVYLPSPWKLNPHNGCKQEGLSSEQIKFILGLPPHPIPPQGMHESIKTNRLVLIGKTRGLLERARFRASGASGAPATSVSSDSSPSSSSASLNVLPDPGEMPG
ncbi:hypothetical protein O181_026036 [Austropuccinia psidii MF-1]|uniref:Uncharacterized protein n=1 Tax=Austropuccinia psidii MF-1 TaxID=1389203 RepID=A0A9Q3CPM3_9BASI|nr:hypothetical protein [Austropuccinia psidii MF-1]